jgi:hypothetical protein
MNRTFEQIVCEARGNFRRWAGEVAKGGPRPESRELLHAGATLGVRQPADLLEHLAEVARHDPGIIGLGGNDDA